MSKPLPPEVIGRVVRRSQGRYRMCYGKGLTRNPALEGRVSVRFVIGRDGAVHELSSAGSDLPDGGVVNCVLRAYDGLAFPLPEKATVAVVQTVLFAPG